MLFALYDADPRTQAQAYAGKPIMVRQLGPDDVNAQLAPASATSALTHGNGLPISLPGLVHPTASQAICEQIRTAGNSNAASLLVAPTSAVTGLPPDNEAGIAASCLPAQTISVQPGHGALVATTLSGGGPGSTYYLVTDGGVKYPVPSSDALSALGYGSASVSAVPSAWMNLLPTGPALDPALVSTASTVARIPVSLSCSVLAAPGAPALAASGGPGVAGVIPGTALPGGEGRKKGQSLAAAPSGQGTSP
jgi:hypothetical protein